MYGLRFSVPEEVHTKSGPMMLSRAEPTESFWQAWRLARDKLRVQGLSCSKIDASWVVLKWRTKDAAVEDEVPIWTSIQTMVVDALADSASTCVHIDTGLGRMRVVADLVQRLGPEISKVCVACPPNLVDAWRAELRECVPDVCVLGQGILDKTQRLDGVLYIVDGLSRKYSPAHVARTIFFMDIHTFLTEMADGLVSPCGTVFMHVSASDLYVSSNEILK